MHAFKISEIRAMMAHFLLGNTFDEWLLSEAQITTFCTYTIDGTFQKTYDDPASEEPSQEARILVPWGRVREFCYSLIRGKRTPISFRFVFVLSQEKSREFLAESGLTDDPDDLTGLYLNVSFRDKRLLITTGTARKNFFMDKTLDNAWDSYVQAFLKSFGIAAEPM